MDKDTKSGIFTALGILSFGILFSLLAYGEFGKQWFWFLTVFIITVFLLYKAASLAIYSQFDNPTINHSKTSNSELGLRIKERIMPTKDYLEIGKALDQQSAEGFSVYQAELSSMHRDLTALGKKLQKEGLINPGWGGFPLKSSTGFFVERIRCRPGIQLMRG